jgi:SLT domain-containing protein
MVEPGETIVPKHLTNTIAPLMKAHGVPGFAAGGITGSYPTPSRPEIFESTDTANFMADIEKNMMQAVINNFKKGVAALNAASSTPVKGVPSNLIPFFQAAIALTGVPSSWIFPLEEIALHESGLNVNAINLTDSNAAAGDPSRGLMQTIMTTFQAYHQAGTSGNIYDPTANIAAAINYIKARYGSVYNVPGVVSLSHGGPYVGYDSGGYLMPGLTMAYNGTGQPEMVTPTGGGSPQMVHAEFVIDGKKFMSAVAPAIYQRASQNNGNARSGKYWAPGN